MTVNQAVAVTCRRDDGGWVCEVVVGTDSHATRHRVVVETEVLERMRPGAAEPEQLVRDSFEFLLKREPRESILRSFELPLIGRYFPEWDREIRRHPAGG